MDIINNRNYRTKDIIGKYLIACWGLLLLLLSSCDERSNPIDNDSNSSEEKLSDIDKIMDNIIKWNTYAASDSVVKSYESEIQDDGSWVDINYGDNTRGWDPQRHYHRILPMALAYINPQSKYYKNEGLYNKIILGINYWITLNIKSPDWYHNQINEPEFMGMILITMRKGDKKIPSEIEERIIEKWRNNESNPEEMTGANRTETALHWLYFACLTKDEELLKLAIYYLFEPIRYVEDEGFQVDGSFFQHGHQLYIGGYGEVLLESVLQSAVCIMGTQYSLPEEKLALLRDYVINSWANVIRGEVMHWNAIGRQLTRPDFLRYPERRIPIIEKMIEVDAQYAPIYNQIRNRLLGISSPDANLTPCHIHFFRGDYTVHVEKNYTFSMRMASTRTTRQERANGENVLGHYLSDGATAITRTGKEYLDLMPFWDWNKIPGTTAPKGYTPITYQGYGTSIFAGGVSDKRYGCSTYKYYDDFKGINTGASKGYFFFENEIVCLGAGINSSHETAQTTINQCWGEASFVAGKNMEYSMFDGDIEQNEIKDYNWILHDKIGYYIPEGQKIVVENKKKTGNWKWISTHQEDKEMVGKVFTLGIEHDGPVQNGKYSYVIIPNCERSSLSAFAKQNDIEILANTDSVQIVYHKKKRLYECIFYKACKYEGQAYITSNQPCALLIQKLGGAYSIHIADPSQSKRKISIGIQEKDMDEMIYGSCDFTGIDDQYAGMTKDFVISR